MVQGIEERPSRVRYGVLAFLAAMTFVLYLDRNCMGQALTIIQKDWGLSERDKSLIQNAFALSYALFEIPTGRWGDRLGSRGVLTRIVVWWSIFTAMTGAAWGFGMLIVVRFLFGAGEAGALPNGARVLRQWFPDSSRARAQGIVGASMMLGGAAANITSQWLMDRIGWRWTFAVFAMTGVVWAAAFYAWFRDHPAEHPEANDAERRLIAEERNGPDDGGRTHAAIPWAGVWRSGNVWLLSALIALSSAMYELISSWYPSYLQLGRGASPDMSARLTSLVLVAGPLAALSGGWLSDWLVRRTGDHRWGRTAAAVAGWGLAGLALFASLRIDSTLGASICVAISAFGVQIANPAWWSCATTISGRHVGALFGLMNMFGSVGRIAANSAVGTVADWRRSLGYTGRAQWDPALYGFVGAAIVGMVLWAMVDPRRVVESPSEIPDPSGTG